MKQHIQYCKAPDGVQLAYSMIGKGTPVVRASHWLTHLEYDLNSPVWHPLYSGLAQRHSLVRYDGRGQGMSQRDIPDLSFEHWVGDLESVVDALALEKFVLLGMSQGACISVAYAVRHPERVSHLILYGAFARGLMQRGDPEKFRRLFEINKSLVREGWGSDHEEYRQWFTSQFIPSGTAEQYHWFNELQRRSATAEMMERFLEVSVNVNVADQLPKVKAPTLVLHCKDEVRVPFALGQELAAGIPGAKFVPLEGKNHALLPNEPAYRAFMEAVADFLGDPPFKGPLPGTANWLERLDRSVKGVEQNWFIKVVIIFAALTGVVIFFLEMWKLLHH